MQDEAKGSNLKEIKIKYLFLNYMYEVFIKIIDKPVHFEQCKCF